MYQTGEALADEGRYEDAVRLIRHAILSLPRTANSDELRHALIMRMAHIQLLAAHRRGDPAHALDAVTMLLAYGERHQALFDDERASERKEIYELLYEAESFAEQLEESGPSGSAAESSEPKRNEVVEDDPDTHAGEELDAKVSRDVRVRRGWLYGPDDPRVRNRLESWFSGAVGYTFLTTPGVANLSGPRAMVRRSGPPTSVDLQNVAIPNRSTLRKVARSVLSRSREGLRECYRSAAARGGELQTEATVELTVTLSGAVEDVIVVEGDVVDGLGDACVIEQLARTTLSDGLPTQTMRLRFPLLFFYDAADTMRENERTDDAGNYDGPRPIPHPEIDDFAFPVN